MEPQTLAERNDYQGRFSPIKFLDKRYKTPQAGTQESELRDFTVKNIHKFFSRLLTQEKKASYQSDKVRVLDYGCGPVLCTTMSAAGIPSVSEIVLAEYTTKSREAIQLWLDKDPSTFDWSPYFKYVVQTLEGKTEQQVAEREERMRSLVKVVPCDISLNPPIENGYEGPYDVVICCLCLETCSNSVDEYRAGIAKLSSLIKPGGSLLISSLVEQNEDKEPHYFVGSHCFHNLDVSYDLITSSLKVARLNIVSVDYFERSHPTAAHSYEKFVFIHAEN